MTSWRRRWRETMDNILHLVGLAKRAGALEAGDEPVGAACRARACRLILVARDAADNTFRRVRHFADAGGCLWLSIPFGKDELGAAVGRTAGPGPSGGRTPPRSGGRAGAGPGHDPEKPLSRRLRRPAGDHLFSLFCAGKINFSKIYVASTACSICPSHLRNKTRRKNTPCPGRQTAELVQ